MRLSYVYVFLFMPLNRPLKGLLLLRRLVERLLDDLLEDVLLEDFDDVLLVLFVVDVFFLLLFNEPKSKLMIVIGGMMFKETIGEPRRVSPRKNRLSKC